MIFPSEKPRFLFFLPPSLKRDFSEIFLCLSLTFGLICLLSAPSVAHDYWYELQGSDYVLYRRTFRLEHEGEAIVPYDPTIIQHAYCAAPNGVVQALHPPFPYPTRIAGPCTAVPIEVDTGYWSETWTTTHNQPKDQVSDAVVSWQALESTKMLNAWTATPLPQPLSNGLEILFDKNPFDVEEGQKLRLLVVLGGNPRGGVTVAYDGKPRGVTGPDGRINIRVRHGGLQVLTGSLKEPPLDPKKADKLIRATTFFLNFQESEST